MESTLFHGLPVVQRCAWLMVFCPGFYFLLGLSYNITILLTNVAVCWKVGNNLVRLLLASFTLLYACRVGASCLSFAFLVYEFTEFANTTTQAILRVASMHIGPEHNTMHMRLSAAAI
jgi:hypothetical protein